MNPVVTDAVSTSAGPGWLFFLALALIVVGGVLYLRKTHATAFANLEAKLRGLFKHGSPQTAVAGAPAAQAISAPLASVSASTQAAAPAAAASTQVPASSNGGMTVAGPYIPPTPTPASAQQSAAPSSVQVDPESVANLAAIGIKVTPTATGVNVSEAAAQPKSVGDASPFPADVYIDRDDLMASATLAAIQGMNIAVYLDGKPIKNGFGPPLYYVSGDGTPNKNLRRAGTPGLNEPVQEAPAAVQQVQQVPAAQPTPATQAPPAQTQPAGRVTQIARVIPIDWNSTPQGANVNVRTADFGGFRGDEAIAFSFHTPNAASPVPGNFSSAESGGVSSGYMKQVVMSETLGDWNGLPGGSREATAATIPFSLGVGNQWGFPTLKPNTDYFVNVRLLEPAAVAVDMNAGISKPHGT